MGNLQFQIYNADTTPFYNLSLRKASVESVVMSLGDKITGDVYYKDDSLVFTMQEYIEYLGVRYVLVNPPTIVREGMVSDNSDLKGMTKYSLVFYHPMYELGNMPFCDVAVTPDESKYLSESKVFNWIGKPADFVAKLNKNLVGTKWIVELGSGFPSVMLNEISEVLSFSNNFISDAIKTFYDQWEVPYIIDTVASTESSYAQGKRFKVIFGLPSQEIYDEGSATPYIFRFGQGVGLKNNSRTPKNNKIITRIAGSGSERNIPYGYPQVRWYGNQNWDYTEYEGTISYDASGHVTNQPKSTAYPLYMGILGGEYVKLIKHPFTRKNLMPSVYYQTLFNKVSPYLQRTISPDESQPTYSPAFTSLITQVQSHISQGTSDIEVAAFTALYNALLYAVKQEVSDTYSKHIYGNGYDGSFEMSSSRLITGSLNWDNGQEGGGEFEFDDVYAAITGYTPVSLITNPNYSPSTVLVDYYDAINDPTHTYPNQINPNAPSFETKEFEDVYPELGQNISIVSVVPINNNLTPAEGWDDTIDGDGNYIQSYFKITLPVLSFDIYACAAITEEMQINMRSGACLGCTFTVQVDWDDYKANFYDQFGNFAPTGSQRNYTKYPDSSQEQIDIILQKDNSTFGTIMPNVYQHPVSGDYFVVLGISLPLSYITSAESRLDEEMKSYMVKNNEYYFEYPLKFDEYFLETHQNILEDIKPNSIVRFNFEGEEKQLYVKQLVVKYDNSPLPKYDITLTDDIEVVINQIGKTAGDVEKLFSMYSYLRQNKDVGNDTKSIQQQVFKSLFSVYNDNEDYTDLFLLSGLPEDQSKISIKAKFGLWTDSFLSALGLNRTSGGSGGATRLDGLEDVTITSPSNGDVLKYLNGGWVNAPDAGGISITDMWTALNSIGTEQINSSHLTTALSNYAWGTQATDYVGLLIGGVMKNVLTAHQTLNTLSIYGGDTKVLDYNPSGAESLYIKAGGDISLSNDVANHYITLSYSHPTNGANTTITAANGLVLSAITVNNLGHVTSVSSKQLAEADIPSLSINKVTGLQNALDAKLDVAFFDSLFELHSGATGNPKVNPNSTLPSDTSKYNIKAMFGFWTEQYISALGRNGDMGGSDALYSLLDVKPDDPANPSKVYGAQTGYVLTYGSDGKWYAAQATGSVTSIIVGTTTYSPVNGVITLPAYPQVPSWALQPNKPSYAFSEITGELSENQIPTASASVKGGIKVGTGLAIAAATAILSLATSGVVAGTYTKLTVDAYGRATAGSTLVASDIPDLSGTYLPRSAGSTYPLTGDLYLNDNAARFSSTANPYSWSSVLSHSGLTIVKTGVGVIESTNSVTIGNDSIELYSSATVFGETATNTTTLTPSGITINGVSVATQGWVNSNFYTQAQADAKYMTIAAFENLFRAMQSDGTTSVAHPYSHSSGVASIKALFGLWTDQYLSALGLNSQGGGGGGSTTLAGLSDVTITSPSTGQLLKYDALANSGNGGWVNFTPNYATTGQLSNYLRLNGGGTLTATGSDIQMLFTNTGMSWIVSGTTYGSLTFSMNEQEGPHIRINSYDVLTEGNTYISGGTIYIGSDSITPLTTSYVSFGTAGADYVPITIGTTTKNVLTSHQSLSGYATTGDLSSYLPLTGGSLTGGLGIGTTCGTGYVLDADGAIRATGMYIDSNAVATQSWVGLQGYIAPTTVAALADGVMIVYDSGGWVTTARSTFLSGYATQTWVQQQGYITSSGSCAYATSAGNADTVDGYHNGQLTAQYFSGGHLLTAQDTVNTVLSGIYAYVNADNPSGTISGVHNCALIAFKTPDRNDQFQIVASANEKKAFFRIGSYVGNPTYENWGYWNEFIHSNNISSYALPLSGGTMTGSIKFNIYSTGYSTTYNEIGVYDNSVFVNVRNNKFVVAKMGTNGAVFDISALTQGRNIAFQDKAGTVALTSDLSSYLPLSGGTLTGTLNCYADVIADGQLYTEAQVYVQSGYDTKIVLDNDDLETYWSKISFRDDGTEYGWLGTTGSTDLKWSGNTIWHAGNDGSGSGLDADLLDGHHNGDLNCRYVSCGYLDSNNSLDSISDGFYYYINANNPTNAIGDNSAMMQISSRFYDRFQLAFPGNSNGYIYYRNSAYSTSETYSWTGWKRLAFASELVSYLPLSGGDITGAISFTASGYTDFSTTKNQILNYNGLLHVNVPNNQFVIAKMGTNGAVLDTSNLSGAKYFYFPATGGTFAMTSDLGSYLPLTGGTVTGALAVNGGFIAGNQYTRVSFDNYGDGVMINTLESTDSYYALYLSCGESTLGTVVNPTFVVRANGNVGIGVNRPSYKLHVANGGIYSANYLITGGYVDAGSIGLTQTAGTGAGISLYDGSAGAGAPTYGIMFAQTSNFGTHGSVNGDWATYFTMSDTANRGWIFRRGSYNQLSIGAAYGTLRTNGEIHAKMGFSAENTNSSGAIVMNYDGSSGTIYADDGNNINVDIDAICDNFYFYTDGYVYGDFQGNSDIRLKNVISYDVLPPFECVANAPSIRFTWNELSKNKNKDIHLGSIAQYWQSILPETISQNKEGYLAMSYDVIALLSAISVAKRVTEHERRIEALERENALLRLELNKLKENIQ